MVVNFSFYHHIWGRYFHAVQISHVLVLRLHRVAPDLHWHEARRGDLEPCHKELLTQQVLSRLVLKAYRIPPQE
jgi:hypothetical protein